MKYPLQWTLAELGAEPGTPAFAEWLGSIKSHLEQIPEQGRACQENLSALTAAELRALIDACDLQRSEWHQAMSLVECYIAGDAANDIYRQAFGALLALKPALEKGEHQLDQVLTSLPAEQLKSWLEDPALANVSGYILRRLQEAAIRLPDELADFAGEMNVDGIQAWSRLYDQLSSAVRIELMERGELVEKSPGQIAFDSPDRSHRENTFFAAQKAWLKIADPCAAALNHLVGSRLTQDRYAGRKNHLVVPMMQNRVTEAAVEAMWGAITDFKSSLVKFLQAKQKLLQLPELCWYDLDAPLSAATAEVSYQTGCESILNAFQAFHPPLYEFSKQALESAWVEAADRPGKRQGGFCIDFPRNGQTRIFMTYRDTEDSLSTLAHELGHAYHSWVLRDQPYVSQAYPMTLAETASTFAETVLAEQRLNAADNDQLRLMTLDRLLSDAVTFLMNIHCRWLFDNQLHETRKTRELSAGELQEMMVHAQRTAYQQALAEGGYNPTFWISKLHFYISDEPFYNFPYTFGYLLSQRLYLEARQDFKQFPSRYDQFLLATPGPSALTAAREAFGFDFESTAFWNEALQPIQNRIELFCQLAEKKSG